MVKKSSRTSRHEDEKYRDIFEHSAVSMWEEDITKLRLRLGELSTAGVTDFRAYLEAHPEFLREAVELIEVTDVNRATLRLCEAERKGQLLGPLSYFLDTDFRVAIKAMILAIAEGKEDVEAESTVTTRTGKRISVIVKSHIPQPGAAHPSMLVSLIDITARKEAEERERLSAIILHSIIDSSPDTFFVKDTSMRMVLCDTGLAHAIGKEPKDLYGKTDIENGWNADLVKGNAEKGIAGWEKDDLAVLSGQTIQVSEEPSDFDNEIRYFDTVKFPLRDQNGGVIGLVGIGRDVTERKKAEVELRRAKEFAENLINTANVMVLGLDLEGRVTIFNRAAEEITGYARAEIMNRSWFETFVPNEQYPGVREKFERLAKQGDVGVFENPIITKAGEKRYISWNNSQILEGGCVTGTLSFGIDITDRRRMEQELAWERSLFNMLMDNLPDRIYFKDRLSRFIRMSRSQALALGLEDQSRQIGKTDEDFFAADHAEKALADEQQIIRTGLPIMNIEERLTFPDRPDTWVITTKMPLRDSAGAIVGTFGISHDITARKQLEAKNQQLAALVDSSGDAIVGMDLDRRITAWSRGAERLYGYSAEEIIGASISILIPPELGDETRTLADRLKRGEEISHFETIRLRKDGSRVNISLTLSPIRDGEGRIVGTAAVGGDITEQKSFQAQLNRAQRLESLATLAGGVAHQFNNINTAVMGYLAVLRSEKSLPTRLATFVKAASAGVQKAVDITDRLLALTEPAGVSTIFPLDVLARSLVTLNEKRIKDEEVLLVLNLAATRVEGDEGRLKFVLSSLIGNALDSLLDRPVRMLKVTTGCTKDTAYFEVEDSGCGIPEEDMPRIFSPFFSAKGEWAPPGSPQAKVKGVGLSLAISSSTVSEYGGRIDVQSTKGAGSTFKVVMPLAGVKSVHTR
jgi:PAS domain S-box-containing protein